MKQKLKDTLKKTPFYGFYEQNIRPYRMARQFQTWTKEDELRFGFYQQFIKPGDVVFDVGANLGNRTKIFLRLQAYVIAVEPQRMCADFLASVLEGNADFKLIRKALGARRGETEMLISNAHAISSLSPDWVAATKKSGRFTECEWNDKQVVEVDTLDNIIKSCARPKFIKIDVEGYEFEVLSGLSEPIDLISIEFTPEYLENTYKCLEHMSSLAEMEYQLSVGESMRFELPAWVSEPEIKEALSRVDSKMFGDIYIRWKRGEERL